MKAHRIFTATALGLSLVATATAQTGAHDHAHTAPNPGVKNTDPSAEGVANNGGAMQMPESGGGSMQMGDMQLMMQRMMAEMKVSESRLDALVDKMNATTGPARLDAISSVINEMVAQQKAMRQRMAMMMQTMHGDPVDQAAQSEARPSVALGTGTVYTANERGNSISAVDLRTARVRTVSVPISPHNIQISASGKWLYAVGETARPPTGNSKGDAGMDGHDGMKGGRLLVLDARRADLRTVADIAVGPHPAHVIADAGERRAFVTDSERNAVFVVDLGKRRVARSIPTGANPHGLRMTPNGLEIYVANVDDDSVSVLSTATLKETARIPVGKAPVQVAVAPNGRRVYVTLRDEDSVAVVDTARRTVLAKVKVGRDPIQLFITPDGRTVFVANQGTDEDPDRTVSLLDTQTNRIVETLTTGGGAHGVVISADGRRAFVSNVVENTMTVMDVPGQQVLRSFAVGDGPNGITYQQPRR